MKDEVDFLTRVYFYAVIIFLVVWALSGCAPAGYDAETAPPPPDLGELWDEIVPAWVQATMWLCTIAAFLAGLVEGAKDTYTDFPEALWNGCGYAISAMVGSLIVGLLLRYALLPVILFVLFIALGYALYWSVENDKLDEVRDWIAGAFTPKDE